MRNFFVQLTWHIVMLVISVLFVLSVRAVDRSFPVLKSFEVLTQTTTNLGVIIEGTVDKVRDCRLVEINAFTPEGHKLSINYMDKPLVESQGTRPQGIQLWGPWEIFTQNNTSVNLYVTHACSIFWSQTSKLTTLTLIKVSAEPFGQPESNP